MYPSYIQEDVHITFSCLEMNTVFGFSCFNLRIVVLLSVSSTPDVRSTSGGTLWVNYHLVKIHRQFHCITFTFVGLPEVLPLEISKAEAAITSAYVSSVIYLLRELMSNLHEAVLLCWFSFFVCWWRSTEKKWDENLGDGYWLHCLIYVLHDIPGGFEEGTIEFFRRYRAVRL